MRKEARLEIRIDRILKEKYRIHALDQGVTFTEWILRSMAEQEEYETSPDKLVKSGKVQHENPVGG